MAEPPTKRRRLSNDADEGTPVSLLNRPISPPTRNTAASAEKLGTPSPFRLTKIRDLPAEANAGAVSLHDILGDPLIAECWNFNYLHDIDFLMKHFDEDVRSLVDVKIVHGFWKREDPNRLMLQGEASQYMNVELLTAFMPEMFGTHHSKILVLFHHDDTAQVIIHTANMIPKDWKNMTNGLWQSPLLPIMRGQGSQSSKDSQIGSGSRFKQDLLNYFRAYNAKRGICKSLVEKLSQYDFSSVRGALVASVPGRHDVKDDPNTTRWGWAALRHALNLVPTQSGKSEIVVQISSIASLGGTDTWLQRTLFDSLSPTKKSPRSDFKVIFPTPDEIRRSLDGYASGGSIHTKIQSFQQAKQLEYMRPIFCHWANDAEYGKDHDSVSGAPHGDAGRNRAAPHIKTYIRYAKDSTIDWALLTSANISKQAWGEAANSGQFRVSSWEIGVLVWPELLTDDKNAKMVGTFKTDLPPRANYEDRGQLVGLRIPYNLPLKAYGSGETPWVATATYNEPDWMEQTWEPWVANKDVSAVPNSVEV